MTAFPLPRTFVDGIENIYNEGALRGTEPLTITTYEYNITLNHER